MSTSGGETGGGGGVLLAQAGAGTPLGAVTPTAKGYLYQDTTNGALYVAVGATSDDWVAVGGAAIGASDAGVKGTSTFGSGSANQGVVILTDPAASHRVTISDTGAFNDAGGSTNGLFWICTGTDGEQSVEIDLGSTDQFSWSFNADGTMNFGTNPAQDTRFTNAPTGTSSATPVMLGLDETFTITYPAGKVLITIDGDLFNGTTGVDQHLAMAYGTGTPPSNGDAAVGTVVGATQQIGTGVANDRHGFSLTRFIALLTQGDTYWVDLQFATTLGTVNLDDVTVTLTELMA